jgi:hypothetical protein
MIDNLPIEILHEISCYLNRSDLLNFMCCSKDIHDKLSYRMENHFNKNRNRRNYLLKKWCPSISSSFKFDISSTTDIMQIHYYFDIMIHYLQFIEIPHLNEFLHFCFCTNYYHEYLQLYFLNIYNKSNYLTDFTKKILIEISSQNDILLYDIEDFEIIDIEIYLYLFNEYKIEFPFYIIQRFLYLSLIEKKVSMDNIMLDYVSSVVCNDISFFKKLKFDIVQQLIYSNVTKIKFDAFCIFIDRFITEDFFVIFEFYYTSIKFLLNNNYIFDEEYFEKNGISYYYSVFYSLFSILIKLILEYDVDDINNFKSILENINTAVHITNFNQFKAKVFQFIIHYDFDHQYPFFFEQFRNFVINEITC